MKIVIAIKRYITNCPNTLSSSRSADWGTQVAVRMWRTFPSNWEVLCSASTCRWGLQICCKRIHMLLNKHIYMRIMVSFSSLERSQGGAKEVCALVGLDAMLPSKKRLKHSHNTFSKLHLLIMRCFVQDTYFANDRMIITDADYIFCWWLDTDDI